MRRIHLLEATWLRKEEFVAVLGLVYLLVKRYAFA